MNEEGNKTSLILYKLNLVTPNNFKYYYRLGDLSSKF
jgi:hypothetical protein